MFNLSNIDKVYIINLIDRPDRKIKWMSQLHHMPMLANKVEFVEAVNGGKIDNKTLLKNGELGCSLSHLKVWKDAINNCFKNILVFEDDVIIAQGFETKLDNLLNNIGVDYDWIYLYNTWDYRPVEPISESYCKVIASLGTQGYLLNISSTNRIQPFVEELRFPVDVVMGHMSFLSKVYRPKEIFVKHDYHSVSNVKEWSAQKTLLQKIKLKLSFK